MTRPSNGADHTASFHLNVKNGMVSTVLPPPSFDKLSDSS